MKKEINALILIDLPMTKEEERICEDYLTKCGLPGARDALLIKYAHMGRLKEVVEGVGGTAEDNVAGTNWRDLRGGIELGMGGRRGLAEV